MKDLVVGAISSGIGWFIQVIGEKLLNDKVDEITSKRSCVELADEIHNLKYQLRKADCALHNARGTQITNKYLLQSMKELEQLASDARMILFGLGHCCCIKSFIDRSTELTQEAIDRSSERSVVVRAAGPLDLSCQICIGDSQNRAKKRKLGSDSSPCGGMREITNELRDIGDLVNRVVEQEALGIILRETQFIRTTMAATTCVKRREVFHRNQSDRFAGAIERREVNFNVKRHRISGYNGFDVSPVFGRKLSGLNSLMYLQVKNSKNLKVLPPLGKLAIKDVASEYYGSRVIMGFPVLTRLKFCIMEKLETWVEMENRRIFARLENIALSSCCMLNFSLARLSPVASVTVLTTIFAFQVSRSSLFSIARN